MCQKALERPSPSRRVLWTLLTVRALFRAGLLKQALSAVLTWEGRFWRMYEGNEYPLWKRRLPE